MRSQIRPAIVSFITLTIITGIIYPALVTGIAKLAFADKAGGSLIIRDGKTIGSDLIAQSFADPKYFWPRPSAAGYNGAGGSGSNVAPSNPALVEAVQARIAAIRLADPSNPLPIPADLVTASGSGLDPHISVAAARYQLHRVAGARQIQAAAVESLLSRHIEGRTFGILGDQRVNVLKLNLALDHPEKELVATTHHWDADHLGGPTLYRWRGVLPDSH